MARTKRSHASIIGEQRAQAAAVKLGAAVRASRRRRRASQAGLARIVGISRQRLSDLEVGNGAKAPPEVWFALGETLGIYLRFEFGRDPQADVRDAGHLDIQELVLRLSKPAGWERAVEAKSGGWASDRSVDVRLIDRKRRRLVISECWNTFGDLGEATRASTRKVRDAEQQAVVVGGEGEPFEVGLVWIVRDTRTNRELIARYGEIFAARFPGSSQAWVNALTKGGPLPMQAGLIWCDVGATRLFARRMPRGKGWSLAR